jgi:hypothetical protein
MQEASKMENNELNPQQTFLSVAEILMQEIAFKLKMYHEMHAFTRWNSC